MTQLTDEHFELHTKNKAEQFERQKIKFLEDRIKTLETAIESHAKILARFQMTEDKDNNKMPEWVTTTGKMRNV
jgi:septal ring factor EnvC (AmiA/AmiB activator)